MISIPVFQNISSKFNQNIVLGNLLINLEFHWNSRSIAWYMDIIDTENDDRVNGVKLVPNWLLLRQFRASVPNISGNFIIIKTDDTLSDRITYENLGNGYDLFYADEDEAESWEDFYGLG